MQGGNDSLKRSVFCVLLEFARGAVHLLLRATKNLHAWEKKSSERSEGDTTFPALGSLYLLSRSASKSEFRIFFYSVALVEKMDSCYL